jgi:uncharacterized protein YegP (UPF0339 family)
MSSGRTETMCAVRPHAHVDYYEDEDGEWRWRVTAANNEIVAAGEGYTRKSDAVRGFQDTARAVRVAWIKDMAGPWPEPKEEED